MMLCNLKNIFQKVLDELFWIFGTFQEDEGLAGVEDVEVEDGVTEGDMPMKLWLLLLLLDNPGLPVVDCKGNTVERIHSLKLLRLFGR